MSSERNHKAFPAFSLHLGSNLSVSQPFHGMSGRALSQMPARPGCRSGKCSHPHVIPHSAREHQMHISQQQVHHQAPAHAFPKWDVERVCAPSPRNISPHLSGGDWASPAVWHMTAPCSHKQCTSGEASCALANDRQSLKVIEMNESEEPLSPLL